MSDPKNALDPTGSAPRNREAEPLGLVQKSLALIEKVGNTLPHPAILFLVLAVLVVVMSWVVGLFDLSVVHPGTGETVRPISLLSRHGLELMLTRTVTNFTGFAPLGTVLVALLGIGVAESTGLLTTALRQMVLSAPRKWLTFAVVFTGVLSNTASEVGYVVLVPLAGMLFLAVGRHPLAGIAAAFAGVSGGYSANLLLGTIDPLLAGLSQEAAQILQAGYTVNPACNYYFMFASAFLVAILGTLVTEKIVIPRLGEYTGEHPAEQIGRITADERRGLFYTLGALFVLVALMLWGTLPEGMIPGSGFMRDAKTGDLLHSPFMSGIVTLIFAIASVLGIAYGIGARTIKSPSDIIHGMGKSMSTLGTYIVLVFFAAQFVAWFNWTNLGLIVAIKGASTLAALQLTSMPLLIGVVLASAFINLFIGSASAKWAIMAPVFIPMLMLLGISPELTQLAYRVGDSVSNIITPMMAYFALIVAFMEKYDPKAGIGTIVATMLPYTVVFLVAWSLFLLAWVGLGIPIGPGAPSFMPPTGATP